MTWDEANNFAWNDLSNFKWEDIELDKYEILAKAENGSVILPPDIREQLLSLCTEIPELHEKKASKSSMKTIADFLSVVSLLLDIAKKANDLGLGIILKQLMDSLSSYLR